MRISFLGTGTSQGIPVIACGCETCISPDPRDKRLRTSVLIEEGNTHLIIDTGPDFRQQMLREDVKKLDAVLFTHEHRDHIAGLDDVRAFNFIQQQAMDVYAEERVIRALKYEFPYIFAEKKYPGIPQVNLKQIEMQEFTVRNIHVIPIRVMHFHLPIMGFRIGDFTYITDANFISEEEKEKIIGTKYLVINALRRETHISHFTLDQALSLINELSPRKAYLTHMSHQIGKHENLLKGLPSNVMPAYDGLKVDI